jgi:hypothetical protein
MILPQLQISTNSMAMIGLRRLRTDFQAMDRASYAQSITTAFGSMRAVHVKHHTFGTDSPPRIQRPQNRCQNAAAGVDDDPCASARTEAAHYGLRGSWVSSGYIDTPGALRYVGIDSRNWLAARDVRTRAAGIPFD